MRRRVRATLLALAAAWLPVGTPLGAEIMRAFDAATPAPFTLRDLDGEPVSLETLRGRPVLLNFWATWCGPCVEELPSIHRLAVRFENEPVEAMAVNVGGMPEEADAFLDRLGIDPAFTVVADIDGAVTRDWGVFAYPSTFLIGADGRAVRARHGSAQWDAPEVAALIESLLPAGKTPDVPGKASGASAAPIASSGRATVAPDELDVPARAGAREPHLVLDIDGSPILSWMEPSGEGDGVRLQASRLVDGEWSAPATVAAGDDGFVDRADFPSLGAFGDGRLAAWWPVRNGTDPYADDLNLALSDDGGRAWSAPFVPHGDGTRTRHGSASMAPWADGRLFVAWLAGRVNAAGTDPAPADPLSGTDMTLRSALVDADGRVGESVLLDERVCTCCGVDAVRTGEAMLVAYRDRSDDEVRDISLVRFAQGRWSEPYPLHADGWRIAGCPGNGPALAADADGGEAVVAAWFTAADDVPAVLVARSSDGGRRFGEPVRIDGGRPAGRVDVVLTSGGDAIASWLENTARGEELRYRWIAPDGAMGDPVTLARSSRGRTIGFPRTVLVGDRVMFAWTQPASDGRGTVRTVMVGL